MSMTRQPRARVRSYAISHPPGIVVLPTQPGWDRVVFAHDGLFTAHAAAHAWTVPAHRAICVPDGVEVRIETRRRSAIRCLYLDRELEALQRSVRVISMPPLTRELLAHAVDLAPMKLDREVDRALICLLADRISKEPATPLHLPAPQDAVAQEVAAAVAADPARPLDEHVQLVGASRRTIERRFRDETGMSLGRWRRRCRILAAVAHLAEGDSVTHVAMRVGYSSPSSFVAAFRSELDQPPLEYLRDHRATATTTGDPP